MLHKDVMDHCNSYDNCQWTSNLVHTSLANLITVLLAKPFTKWGMDFIGPIKAASRYTCNRYVLFMLPNGWRPKHCQQTLPWS
jgi:hypothetical protein